MLSLDQARAIAASVLRPPIWAPADEEGLIRLGAGSQADPVADLDYILSLHPNIEAVRLQALLRRIGEETELLLRHQQKSDNILLMPTVLPAKEFDFAYQPGGEPLRKALWQAQGFEPACNVYVALVIKFKIRSEQARSCPSL